MPRKSNTRAPQGSGSIRQRPDGLWEARFYVNGVRRSLYAPTQAEARKKLTAATSDADNGQYVHPSQLTLKAWAAIWEKEYLTDVKASTRSVYHYDLEKYILPALGKVRISALTTPAIQSVYNKLTKEGLSPKSTRDVHGVLHRCLADAVAVGYIRVNPSSACKLPKKETPQLAPFDETQAAAFLEAIKGHRLEGLFYVALFTGLRQGELLGLRWSCVNFKTGTITIDKQLQKARDGSGTYSLVSPKNGKPRYITPAPSVMAKLKRERTKQIQNRFKAGQAWDGSMGLVFTDELGRYLNAHSVYCAFKRIAEKIGAPAARFHDLRHSYAVLALRAGNSIKDVQDSLGHYSAAFTMDTYAFVTQQMQQEAADKMEAQIKALKQA